MCQFIQFTLFGWHYLCGGYINGHVPTNLIKYFTTVVISLLLKHLKMLKIKITADGAFLVSGCSICTDLGGRVGMLMPFIPAGREKQFKAPQHGHNKSPKLWRAESNTCFFWDFRKSLFSLITIDTLDEFSSPSCASAAIQTLVRPRFVGFLCGFTIKEG